MKSKILMALFIIMIIRPGFSQSSIQGRIYDVDSNGIAFANVVLLNQADSLLVKGAVTDESGSFNISGVPFGDYRMEFSMLGYVKAYLPAVMLSHPGEVILAPIILTEDQNELDEVTVKATKPLYEVELGKMVINVQSSITSAGLSAIDVLERSPGVYVNRQNQSFSVGGKDGVAVLMNGKRSRMPMEALYQMLAGLNAGDIEKIEIITVPPANYDSDGDAGFVNIVMKRNSDITGTSATLTTGLGYGSGPQANFSLSLNHQGKKVNWFGSYGFNYIYHRGAWESYRESSNESESVSASNTAKRPQKRIAHNYQFGVDFLISERLILSGLLSGYNNRVGTTAPTVAFFDYSVSPDTLVESTIYDLRHWKHAMGNVNLQYSFNNHQVLNANLDYLKYYNSSPSQYSNSYYSGDRSFIQDEENSITKDTPINMWVAKVDHSIKIGESTILESGIKSTFSNLINKVNFKTKRENSWIENPKFSSYSGLTENIFAIFSSIKFELDTNTTINAGIRYEHSNTQLETREEGRVVDRDFGNLFPSLFIYRRLNENNKLQLSYGRRITRPTFNEMATHGVFVDPYTFFGGNENILPTFTQILKSDYLYKSLIFSLQYSHDKDVIMRYQPRIDPETNILILYSDNIDRRNTLAATVTLPIQASPWWEIQNNLSANRQRIDTELDGEVYQVAQEGFQLNSTHTFELPEKYAVELAGYYFSSIINGYLNWLPRWFINFGVKKEFNYGGVLRLSCNDIFDSNRVRWKSHDNAGFRISGKLRPEGQGFVLTYTHNFGNSKVKGIRKRAVGSQEEQNRVTN